jgi:hypothetical protein
MVLNALSSVSAAGWSAASMPELGAPIFDSA